jgi:hypothetical protein
MGTFETPILVPELSRAPVKVSSVILSTQLLSAVGRKTVSPLVRDNIEIVPNLTHVVNQDQKLYFYYEVYDPNATADAHTQLRTSLAFYRGKVKVFETPIVERTALDVLDRKAAVFQFEVPADQFVSLYTCQVNTVDEVASVRPAADMQLAAKPEIGGAAPEVAAPQRCRGKPFASSASSNVPGSARPRGLPLGGDVPKAC